MVFRFEFWSIDMDYMWVTTRFLGSLATEGSPEIDYGEPLRWSLIVLKSFGAGYVSSTHGLIMLNLKFLYIISDVTLFKVGGCSGHWGSPPDDFLPQSRQFAVGPHRTHSDTRILLSFWDCS